MFNGSCLVEQHTLISLETYILHVHLLYKMQVTGLFLIMPMPMLGAAKPFYSLDWKPVTNNSLLGGKSRENVHGAAPCGWRQFWLGSPYVLMKSLSQGDCLAKGSVLFVFPCWALCPTPVAATCTLTIIYVYINFLPNCTGQITF